MAEESRAWTYTAGYPDTLKLSNISYPHTDEIVKGFGPPRILVRVHACALNPVDIQMMNLPSWKLPWNSLYGKEKGTVCDFSGTVMAGGETGFKQGDEVFGLTLKAFEAASGASTGGGALGEVADLNMSNCVVARKPKEWSHEKAAAISLVWLTAKQLIDSVAQYVDGSKNKRVAILGGSSATGTYSIILAKRKGWKVVTTSSSKNKDFVTNSLKADEHVDYTTQNTREAVTKFEPDAVIDCVGGTECIGIASSKRYSTIVGDKTGRTSMGGPYTYYDYLHPYRAAVQWLRWAKGQFGMGESYDIVMLGMKQEWLEDATKTLSTDDIYIDSTFAFEDAKQAFERLNTGRARGKVVVKTI